MTSSLSHSYVDSQMELELAPHILCQLMCKLNEKVEMHEQINVLPKILEGVEQIKSQQNEILNLLRQQNQLLATRTITTTPNSCSAESTPSLPSKQQKTVFVYNTISTPSFLNFEKFLQSKMTEISPPKKCKWLRCSNGITVKTLKNVDAVPQNPGLILLCCFSAAATVDPSTIVPHYVYLRSQGYLVVCVCFRPDSCLFPAKIFENSASMEEVPTYSIHVNKKGIINTPMTNETIKSITALLSRSD